MLPITYDVEGCEEDELTIPLLPPEDYILKVTVIANIDELVESNKDQRSLVCQF